MNNDSEELLNEVEPFWEFYHMTVETCSILDIVPTQYLPAKPIWVTPNGAIDDTLATVIHCLIKAKDPEMEKMILAEELEALCDALNRFRTDFIRLKWSSFVYPHVTEDGPETPENGKRCTFAPSTAQVLPWLADYDGA
jgi:hypothetical protein